jgi:hypothetical protein
MRSRISLRKALLSTTWNHWREAGVFTAFSLLGGVAPLWIGLIVVESTGGVPYLVDFAKNGEFALYSAALLAPAFYIVVHDQSETPFAARAIFSLIALAGIVVAVTCYTLVAPETSRAISFVNLQRDLVGRGTIYLFWFCLFFSLLVTTLENARMDPAVRAIVERQEKELDDDFDRL